MRRRRSRGAGLRSDRVAQPLPRGVQREVNVVDGQQRLRTVAVGRRFGQDVLAVGARRDVIAVGVGQ